MRLEGSGGFASSGLRTATLGRVNALTASKSVTAERGGARLYALLLSFTWLLLLSADLWAASRSSETPASATVAAPAAKEPPALVLLQTAAEVRDLRVEEADRTYPIRLRGVVTYYDPAWPACFIQDSTAGVFVYPAAPALLERGNLVEVEGKSERGLYAPIVDKGRFKVIATA